MPCITVDCQRPLHTRGLCLACYKRLRYHNQIAPFWPSTEARFWSKVEKTETCWNWMGWKEPDGYGVFHVKSLPVRAHRYAYQLTAAIPDGLVIDHLCRNRGCVNPDHLEPVSSVENLRRSPLAPIVTNPRKTHCPAGHPYDAANTYVNPKGHRSCRICYREAGRRWSARQRMRFVSKC